MSFQPPTLINEGYKINHIEVFKPIAGVAERDLGAFHITVGFSEAGAKGDRLLKVPTQLLDDIESVAMQPTVKGNELIIGTNTLPYLQNIGYKRLGARHLALRFATKAIYVHDLDAGGSSFITAEGPVEINPNKEYRVDNDAILAIQIGEESTDALIIKIEPRHS